MYVRIYVCVCVCMYEMGEASDTDGRCDVWIQSYQKCQGNRPLGVLGIDGSISLQQTLKMAC
jgi:hypothetical protein